MTQGVAVVSARLEDLLIDLRIAGLDWADASQPLGLVDLRACPADIRLGPLPPFPLIGMGDASHPLARTLDAVVESPLSVEALVRQIARAPRAAALAAQLLRGLEGLAPDRALQFESLCYGLLQGSEEHARWLTSRAALPRRSCLKPPNRRQARFAPARSYRGVWPPGDDCQRARKRADRLAAT